MLFDARGRSGELYDWVMIEDAAALLEQVRILQDLRSALAEAPIKRPRQSSVKTKLKRFHRLRHNLFEPRIGYGAT